MIIKKFEDLITWQKAQDLAVDIYANFDVNRDFNFKNQICSEVVSISNNIAEGFDRSSDADFSRFLYMYLGSASEVRSMLHLAERLKYINMEIKNDLINKVDEVSKIIRGLIKSLTPKN
ncbi:MAG: four helix bundle protein [Chitinophagales bacterium]